MLYYKNREVKSASVVFAGLALLTIVYYSIAIKLLPGFARPYEYVETPLPYITDWSVKLGTALYSLLYYIKLLVVPFPLSFYYGINYIALKPLTAVLPLLSFLLHLGLLAWAVFFFKRSKFVSFFLLFYLIQISPGSNILQPLPGVVGERVLFTASLAFCMLVSFAVFSLLKAKAIVPEKGKSVKGVIVLHAGYLQTGMLLIVLLVYSAETFARNLDWKDTITLFNADMPHLQNSAKANYMMAKEIRRLYRTNKELTREQLEAESARAIHYYNQAIKAYPDYAIAMEELAMIYAIELKNNSMAIPLFEKAWRADSTLWRSANNMAMALQMSNDTTGAITWYEKSLKAKRDNPKVLVELGKLYYLMGEKQKALATNDTLFKLHPDSYLPYYNYGVYYMLEGDTAKAVQYFEEDIKRGERERFPYIFLIKRYLARGDTASALRVRNFAPRVSR